MLGLNANLVRLEKSDSAWPARFQDESTRLRRHLRDWVTQIEHIGSTAVPGLDAKPIIDIAITTPSLQNLPQIEAAMTAAGYVCKGEFGLPGRQFFTRGDPVEFHTHIVESGSQHWTQWIRFRDALRRDAEILNRYRELKHDLAVRFSSDRPSYTAAKTEFIAKILSADHAD
jgi:GrpB-like predicted nucleotidyltransferase (UPF0157 family)